MTNNNNTGPIIGFLAGLTVFLALFVYAFCTVSVDKGEVKVGYRFGKLKVVQEAGLHFAHPLTDYIPVDIREKTLRVERIRIPSNDQQTSTVDVSVQYRANPMMAHDIISETGSVEAVEQIHIIPKLESVVRQGGRSLQVAEDLYSEGEVERIANEITATMKAFLDSKGVILEAVLLKNVDLPDHIELAIQQKKVRDQKAEEEKAELERFKTEQEQKVASANAELQAAKSKAEQIRALADAKAYEIEKLNTAIADNPAYIQLESINALKAMSKDPAAKLYFMDSNSVNPIPLMNIGSELQRK